MMKGSVHHVARVLAVAVGVCTAACSPSGGPQSGTQTNWLSACRSDADCGELQCLCGACTRSCDDVATCSELPDASCVPAADEGAIALCSGSAPTSAGMCLPRCASSTGSCPSGTTCAVDVCVPLVEPTASVSVDVSQRFQTLVGIGAAVGYVFDEIVQHPRKVELYDTMFSGSGFSMLRLRNLYGVSGSDLESTREIVNEAAARLGRRPTIILNSASPPPALKENGSTWCEGNPDTCTLAKLPDGSFDYAGLGSHWRATVEAYAAEGIALDYISIQNNPDWVPATGQPNEACKFLPREGTAAISSTAGTFDVEYPGYAEALDAVLGQLAGLASAPKIAAPETTGFLEVADYLAELDLAQVDVIAHHLYNTDATNLDLDALATLGALGQSAQRPLFQSEMHADPLTTAVLMHAALGVEGAAVYIDNGFVASASDINADSGILIKLTDDAFVVGDNYHVMRQYSAHIGPGWVRVAAHSDNPGLLASAWISPDNDATVVVLTNPGLTERDVRIDAEQGDALATDVTRTVLAGLERSADLGALPAGGVVTVPGQSIVTVTIQK